MDLRHPSLGSDNQHRAAADRFVIPDITSSCQSMSSPVRLTTMHVCTFGQDCSALSALALSGTVLPPRKPSSAVITIWQSESRMRSFSAFGRKTAKHDRMHGADACAGQHGVARLRESSAYKYTPGRLFLHRVLSEHWQSWQTSLMQFAVGDFAIIRRDRRLPRSWRSGRRDFPDDDPGSCSRRSAWRPRTSDIALAVIPVQHLVPGFEPVRISRPVPPRNLQGRQPSARTSPGIGLHRCVPAQRKIPVLG